MKAAFKNQKEVVQLLLAHSAVDVNIINRVFRNLKEKSFCVVWEIISTTKLNS
jgi:hypothetical protein